MTERKVTGPPPDRARRRRPAARVPVDTVGASEVPGSAEPPPARLSREERVRAGKQARTKVPRASHAAFDRPADQPSPVDLLKAQSVGRVPDLIPLRCGRMMASALTFYRGAADVMMANDLAGTPTSGLRTEPCGDGYLSNV
jgi:hypothetical protein